MLRRLLIRTVILCSLSLDPMGASIFISHFCFCVLGKPPHFSTQAIILVETKASYMCRETISQNFKFWNHWKKRYFSQYILIFISMIILRNYNLIKQNYTSYNFNHILFLYFFALGSRKSLEPKKPWRAKDPQVPKLTP